MADQLVDRVADPVVGPVIETSAVSRNARRVVGPVVGPRVSRAASPVDNAVAKVAPLAVVVLVRGVHPMIVRNARRVRWARPSPKKSTSPNSTRLF